MSTLTEIRTEFAELLGVALGWPALAFLPEDYSVPEVVVLPASPYVEPGDAFGSQRVHLSAVLVVTGVGNENATAQLDDAISAAVPAVLADGWTVESVSEPYALVTKNTSYLAVDLVANAIDSLTAPTPPTS